MSTDNITLAQLESLGMLNRPTLIHFKLLVYQTYDEFCSLVQEALNFITNEIEKTRQFAYDLNEDQITNQIVLILLGMGFRATHDQAIGGHCDVVVEGKPNSNDLWIGEAKIHNGYEWLWDGFLQLDSRYSVGNIGSSAGGIIIYCKNERTDIMMNKWKNICLSN